MDVWLSAMNSTMDFRWADDSFGRGRRFLSFGVGFNRGSDDTFEPIRPILSSARREIYGTLVKPK